MICERCGKPFGKGATRCWNEPCLSLDCDREPFEIDVEAAIRGGQMLMGVIMIGLILSGAGAAIVAKTKFEAAAAEAERTAEIKVPT